MANKKLQYATYESGKKHISSMKNDDRNKKKKQSSPARTSIWLLILATILVITSIFLFVPPQDKINQGLDIQGGISVVLTAKSDDGSAVTEENMEKSRAVIESRVNALGASEASVQVQGTDQILVQVPGLTDAATALDTIGATGKLEFAPLESFTDETVKSNIQMGLYADPGAASSTSETEPAGDPAPEEGESATTPAPEEGAEASPEGTATDISNEAEALPTTQDPLVIEPGTYTPIITGENIDNVNIGKESETSPNYSVNLRLDAQGTAAFAAATKELAPTRGQIVIILDGVVQSAPSVNSEITNGDVAITGGYTLESAKSMQTVLESGSLPVSFEFEQSQVVGPTLGQDALMNGVLAAGVGLLAVMIYLLFFYRGLGLIMAGGMVVFACIYLGILAALSAFGLFSLSLAGVAGIVLTIGLAADSSILVIERFREEIRMGRSVRASSLTGVKHAILTSIDADLVTLVSALCLFLLATASVKGFGLTLAIGILCDITMMLLFKAPLIRLLAPKAIANNPGFWGITSCIEQGKLAKTKVVTSGIPKGNQYSSMSRKIFKKDINFLGVRKIFLIVGACVIVGSIAIFGIRGINLGIDFVGGTSATFQASEDITTDEVRDAFAQAGEPDAVVQTTANDSESGFIVRTAQTDHEAAASSAQGALESLGIPAESIEISTIGPGWGQTVIQASIIAFLVSIILIIIYIAIRFEYKMGVTAIVALLHDLILVGGVYALVGFEVTPNTIAALLTILGYSLYDTVVVFHRINDNVRECSPLNCTFMSIANHSVNQVFMRTINTTLTSIIPVICMLFFAGGTLQEFAFAMSVGLISGSYSSIAIATPLYSIWKSREPEYRELLSEYGDEVELVTYNTMEGAQIREAEAKA